MKRPPFTTRTVVVLTLTLFVVSVLLFIFHFRQSRLSALPLKASASDAPAHAHAKEAFGKLPLYFVENRGQTDARVRYYVQGSDKAIYFGNQGLTFILNEPRQKEAAFQPATYKPATDNSQPQRWAIKLDFVGARADSHPEGEAQTEAVISYFKGHSSKWKTELKTYSRIVYRDLWPGIDLVYAGTVNRMKYSFVVRPGADPNQIQLAYRGASDVAVNDAGELEVRTPAGGFTDDRPVSFQEVNGRQVEIGTAYRINSKSQISDSQSPIGYGFAVGNYDRSRELIIDPAVLIYAGYIGGGGNDGGASIAVDSAGSVYITGNTDSTQATFPDGDGFGALSGPDSTFNGITDVFVAKVNSAGTALVYVCYIGGSGNESGNGIAVDSTGNAYVTGVTESSQATFPDGDGFGTLNGPDITHNGFQDAFVVKVNAAGTALVYAGYIGGSNGDIGRGIAVDSNGNAYVVGETGSTQASFPDGGGFGIVTGPDTTFNGSTEDAFVVKVNAMGTAFVYASYIGGSAEDRGLGIAVDNVGAAYLTGFTKSNEGSFPDGDGFGALTGPDTTHNGGVQDAFVVKINAPGTAFSYAGFIGGSGGSAENEIGHGIAVDSGGNAYVTGETNSTGTTFPDGDGVGGLPGPDATYNGGSVDAFVVKVNATGAAFSYAGYIGGSSDDRGLGIAVDVTGATYVAGQTFSSQATFPDGDGFGMLTGPDTTLNGSSDAYIAKINITGTALVYAGYIGGFGGSAGFGIAVDSVGSAYVAGQTDATQTTFPDGDGFGALTGPDTTYNGGNLDVFVAKISNLIVVNTTADTVAADGFCSLREAIQAANTNAPVNECPAGLAGLDTIQFNLGAGTPTINVQSNELPAISEPAVIDGATGGATRVELRGPGLGGFQNGLTITAGNSTIKSLVINNFNNTGILIPGINGGNTIQNCFIGTNATGTAALPNSVGIFITGSAGNLIGGETAGAGNVIAFNRGAGIRIQGISDLTGNRIQNNSIFSNDALGIDLGTTGVNPNDSGDGDTGENNLQNFPVLTSAVIAGSNTIVQGMLNSAASTNFRIEFFSNPACDASGNGEGQVFLGFVNTTTDAGGNATINFPLPAVVAPGHSITATATDSDNNTSEFSQCVAATCSFVITPGAASSSPVGGNGSVNVMATGGCVWTATSNAPWITVTGGGSGNGNGVVSYTIADNAGATPRVGSMTIAGQTFFVNQAATGLLLFTDFSDGVPPPGWTVINGGTGGGAAATWALNPCNRVIPAPFSGGVAIVDSACADPEAVEDEQLISPPFDATGLGEIILKFDNQFQWFSGGLNEVGDVDVSTNGGANWINVLRIQGGDDGFPTPNTKIINLTPFIAANPASLQLRFHYYTTSEPMPRAARNRVSKPAIPRAPTGQELSWGIDNVSVLALTIAPRSGHFTSAGDSGSIGVTVPATSFWTAQSNDSWITIAEPGGGTGSGSIGYVVLANTGACQRTGTITVNIPDSGQPLASTIFTVTQDGLGLTIVTPSLLNGFVGTAYNQTVIASSGTLPYTFTVSAGALPGGLNLSAGGILSGTPTATGTFNFTVKATDAINCMSTRAYIVIISGSGLQFYPLAAPVRLLDTRTGTSGCVTGTGAIAAGLTRTQAARTACSTIPANATAIIGNITVVPSGPGYLTLFPSDAAQPTVANSNFTSGEVTNNFFTVGLGTDGAFKIFTSATTDVIIDLTGYYAPPSTGGLFYHSLPSPVRLVQTFPGQTGCFLNGSQQLAGQNNPNANPALDLVVDGRGAGLPSPCNGIPSDAVVLVGNATTVFPQAPFGFGYLTIYPSDATRPTVASSNYGNNDIINGPFAVKLGPDGKFKVYTFSTTHLVIDISGYYSASAVDANGAGLLFNPLPSPMRLLETRNIPGFPLVGCSKPQAPITGGTGGIRTQQVWGTCSDQPISIPNTSQAIVGNVTAINPTGAGFGTFFPGNVGTAPTVAVTNYPFPVVFGYNRHYYVGLSPTDGTFKILTQFTSDYIVDVSGYFAP